MEEERQVKVLINGELQSLKEKTKRLKSAHFTNLISHYNDSKLFEDEVENKRKKCEILNEWMMC